MADAALHAGERAALGARRGAGGEAAAPRPGAGRVTVLESLRFTANVDGIPECRRWVVEQARRSGCSEPSLRTLALLTTEAVANAVQHGPDGGDVSVTVSVVPDGWRVAVTDESPELPVLNRVRPHAVAGRGVMLIDYLATAWGVESHDGTGKTVWFHVAPPREGD